MLDSMEFMLQNLEQNTAKQRGQVDVYITEKQQKAVLPIRITVDNSAYSLVKATETLLLKAFLLLLLSTGEEVDIDYY